MHGIDRAAGGPCGGRGPEHTVAHAEPHLLALQEGLHPAHHRIGPRLRPPGKAKAADQQDQHDPKQAPGVPSVAYHQTEGVHHGRRNDDQAKHLQKVGQGRRIFKGVSTVLTEETAAVGAKLLDGNLRRRRTHRQHLPAGVHPNVIVRVLNDALRHQRQGQDDRQWQQYVKYGACKVDPEVADGVRHAGSKTARQRHHDGHSRGGGNEILDSQPQHLDEVPQRGLPAVVLPVGVGHKTHRDIECGVRRDGRKAARIPGQRILQPKHRINR